MDACVQEQRDQGSSNFGVCFSDPGLQPPADSGLRDPRFHRDRLKGILIGSGGVLLMVAWLLGASLVGSEYPSRSMTTALTYEPRRLRLIGAKAVVAIATGGAFAVGSLALVSLCMLPALVFHGAPAGFGDPSVATIVGVALRGTALSAIAAGIGFAIATVGRNTAAALGAGFAYIVILEQIIGGVRPKLRRWLLLGNIVVFLSGETSTDIAGRSVFGAGVFLSAVVVALVIGASSVFAYRDVG
jgi:hypothetical protein